ncbi:VC0807 family protein [Actinomycetospora sp. NBRC 106375]|uniref:VC0807 family protein n=1 Tax=Actinomycetospora sp. NBRC 106375 TaxID=3032207 RepID=UPI002556DD0E|nr:VC0807 family protein [Actinomycetospora sp. NBRC 106375]
MWGPTVAKILPWVLTALLSVAFPIVAYDVATDHGVGEVPALLLGAIGPVAELVITAVWRRRLDEFSTVVLVFLALGVVAALFFDDPRLILLKESAVTGLFGLVLLVTVPTSRPLMFLFGRRFATNGDPERVAWWNGLWAYPGFRRTQRGLTLMWGATFVVEAVARAVLTYRLPVATMVVVNAVVPPVVIALLITATVVWARRSRRAGEARTAALAQAV